MYRRNISHVLGTLGILLVLFVLYHSWVKPTYIGSVPASRPPAAEPSTPSAPQPETTPAQEPIVKDTPTEQRRQQRLVPTGEPPDNRFADNLRRIHEDIERHEVARALAGLTTVPDEAMKDPKVRSYAASLWNNLGVLQERTGGTAASLAAYHKASTLDPQNTVSLLNLTHAYWEQRDRRMTQQFLQDVIVRAPNDPFPHIAMADLLQQTDQLAEAGKHLAQASARAKQDPNVQSYLEGVKAKVLRTAATEQKFSSQATQHFVVKYDGEEDQTTWMVVVDILEDAYRDIGQKLGYQPTKPIYVILHTRDTFQGATGSPAWADGLYDGSLGRIQIPTQGALTDKDWLTRVLRHEFVHALLHERMGAQPGVLPTWLNEGLAMQLAGDPWPDIDEVLKRSNSGEVELIPLSRLEGGWSALPAEVATIAYLEGNSATHYLIDRFGMNTVRELLASLKAKRNVSSAIQEQLFMPYEQFQQQWIDTLNEKLSASKG